MTTAEPTTADRIADLLRDNDGIIWQIAHQWHRRNPTLDLDDLHAEVRLGFIEAAHRYDPGRGAKFTTYAGWHGNNRARQFVRREAAGGQHVPSYKGMVRVLVGSIDMPDDPHGRENRGVNAAAPEPEDRPEFPADLWDRIRAVLPAPEYAAVVGWFRGKRVLADIGAEWGVCKERIRQRIASAFETIRQQLPELAAYLEV